MNMSDLIAQAIADMMEETGSVSLRRNELAGRMGCAPSQINYVLTSRFTPEQGYIVESQRGGGGYIRITRVTPGPKLVRMHIVNMIGEEIDARTARIVLENLVGDGYLEAATAKLMLSAMTDTALHELPSPQRGRVRAGIFKQMLLTTLQTEQ